MLITNNADNARATPFVSYKTNKNSNKYRQTKTTVLVSQAYGRIPSSQTTNYTQPNAQLTKTRWWYYLALTLAKYPLIQCKDRKQQL